MMKWAMLFVSASVFLFCYQLLLPQNAFDAADGDTKTTTENGAKVAVVTLVTTSTYVPGAEVLGVSLQKVNATGDRVLLYVLPEDDQRSDLTEQHIQELRDAGWSTTKRLTKEDGTFTECRVSEETQKLIDSSIELVGMKRYWGTCSKFATWALIDYDKVVYMDADSVALHNFDFVYDYLDEEGVTLVAQGTPPCWEVPPACEDFYTAFLVIKPLLHIHEYLHDLAENKVELAEGDITLLNSLYATWKPLPRYTLVAQTETARPLVDPERHEVDWNRVIVYDFAGLPSTKPWVTYELQKQTGDKYAHGYFQRIPPDSEAFHTYMYPQWLWNDYYDEILERKISKLTYEL